MVIKVEQVDGPQGFTGYQGNTLSWWHSYKFNYDTTLTGTPASGNAQRLLHPSGPFSISEGNKDDFSLLRLVSLGVLKRVGYPFNRLYNLYYVNGYIYEL